MHLIGSQNKFDIHTLKTQMQRAKVDVVNRIGADLNRSGPAVLSCISGLNQDIAAAIVQYREANGAFTSRAHLSSVQLYDFTENAYFQAAGFLRVPSSETPLDNMTLHPQHYQLARNLLAQIGETEASLTTNQEVYANLLIPNPTH